ncbi:hypothetical protein ACLESO_59540, partial [Pyxidicoccus sp. 3LG]
LPLCSRLLPPIALLSFLCAAVTTDSYGPEAKALISKSVLPYGVTGELTGPLMRVPYSLSGEVKLNVSR